MLFSIKMRASEKGSHISGAERIVSEEQIPAVLNTLFRRSMHHALGRPDSISLKVEAVDEQSLIRLKALPVSSYPSSSQNDAFAKMLSMLQELGIHNAEALVQLLQTVTPMRGAVLYDIAAERRTEPDPERGVRVTYMDSDCPDVSSCEKNHFREALLLATKVVSAPGVLAELCISDDPDYVTGYLASRMHGYVRLAPLKAQGSRHGGRIIVYDSRAAETSQLIGYLQKQPVLVTDVPSCAAAQCSTAAAASPEDSRKTNSAQSPDELWQNETERLRQNHLLRTLRTVDSEQSRYVTLEGRQILLLSSNSYLDLAADPRVKQAAAEAALQYGAGSGGSRLTTGSNTLHARLEQALAEFKGTESALLFNTGYTANVGIISALLNRDSVVFSDELNHASIIDGCRLSRAKTVVYRHGDMADLERRIQEYRGCRGLIVSDAVFSMDGDIADLPDLVGLGRKYGIPVMLDEAHATGVIGATGRGIAEYYGDAYRPDILMGTLSKALGSEGGFVCGSRALTDYLANRARSFIFSTSSNPAAVAAALAALEILKENPQRVHSLQKNTEFFCRCLQNEGLKTDSQTAIVPIIIGGEEKAVRIADLLLQEGIWIPAIRYPTVGRGSARLRAALMSTHTEEELAGAARLIAGLVKSAAQ